MSKESRLSFVSSLLALITQKVVTRWYHMGLENGRIPSRLCLRETVSPVRE